MPCANRSRIEILLWTVCCLLLLLVNLSWELHSAVTINQSTPQSFIYCTWGIKLLWIQGREDGVTGYKMNWLFSMKSLNNDVGDYCLSTVAFVLLLESISLLNQLCRRFSRGFLLCTETGKQIKPKDRWDKRQDLMGLLPSARIPRLQRHWGDKRIDEM